MENIVMHKPLTKQETLLALECCNRINGHNCPECPLCSDGDEESYACFVHLTEAAYYYLINKQ